MYEEKKEFNVLRGKVPNFNNFDLLLSFTIEDKDGNKVKSNTIPAGTDYDVSIICDNEATGTWNYEEWGPDIRNLKESTKCNINFKIGKTIPLITYGINETIVENGSGLYRVEHNDAEITYTTNETIIANLKQTEYRYAGVSPNNYVSFNNELWRIIGLVNTPEGQRLKIVKNESIGSYSWDSSSSSINYGRGINEWNQADLKILLNSGAYYNRTSGTCYNNGVNTTTACDFSTTGLTSSSKSLIDSVTWNTGAVNIDTVSTMYNDERSNNTGKKCSSGTYCNDTVTRATSWKGLVGLIYPTDYGYATSGSSTVNRESCLNISSLRWRNEEFYDCKDYNWIYKNSYNQWTISPANNEIMADGIIGIYLTGEDNFIDAHVPVSVHPSLYLKKNVKISSGNGTSDSPYQLIIE